MTTAPRRARRADANQAAIVAALRAIPGVQVIVWNGECDLVVGHAGRNYLLEIKRGPKAKIKPSQERLRTSWPGQYAIVSSAEEAIFIITGGSQ